ncbi:PHD-finger domain-containing protein [Phthorimaea operculella]|nr:PHD-finger domain-containing protein [Phthorimaea operculella]
MKCGVCKGNLSNNNEDTVSCSACALRFHVSCLGLPREEAKKLRTSDGSFCCPVCNTMSTNLSSIASPSVNLPPGLKSVLGVDLEKATKYISGAGSQPVSPSGTMSLSAFQQSLNKMQTVFDNMRKEMSAFTTSMISTTRDMEIFRKDLNDVKKQIKELDHFKTEVSNLRAEVDELRTELASRQQHQFLKDVEITGVTEHRGENIHQIVQNLSNTLGVQLDPRDVDDVRRVGKRTDDKPDSSERGPRPLVLTLTRRVPRDQILKAAKVRRNLTTEKIGVAGTPRKIYVNEHLTKENRILFSKARTSGKVLGFKYVWSSNGYIFMRRSDTSSVLRVTSESVLQRLHNSSKPNPQQRDHEQTSRADQRIDGSANASLLDLSS